jgi:beta-glucosidase
MKRMLGPRLPEFTPAERDIVMNSSDFFGLNSYTTSLIKAPDPAGKNADSTDERAPDEIPDASTMEVLACVSDTQIGPDGKLIGRKSGATWLVNCPWGFRKLLRYINKKYIRDTGLVIMITEQGFPVRAYMSTSFCSYH